MRDVKLKKSFTEKLGKDLVLTVEINEIKNYKDEFIDYSYVIKSSMFENSIVFCLKTYSENLAQGLLNYYKNIVHELYNHQEDLKDLHKKNKYKVHKTIKGYYVPYLISDDTILVNYFFNRTDEAEEFIEENKDNVFTQEMIVEYLLYYSGDVYKDNLKQIKIDAIEHCKQYPTHRKYLSDDYDFTDFIKYCNPYLRIFSKEQIDYLTLRWLNPIPLVNHYDFINTSYKAFVIAYNVIKGNDLNININSKIQDIDSDSLALPDNVTDEDIIKYNFLIKYISKLYFTDDFDHNTKQLADYINDLTVKQYIHIIQVLDNTDAAYKSFETESFIKLCETIREVNAPIHNHNEKIMQYIKNTDTKVTEFLQNKSVLEAPLVNSMIKFINDNGVNDHNIDVLEKLTPETYQRIMSSYTEDYHVFNWLTERDSLYCSIVSLKLNTIKNNDETVELLRNITDISNPLSYEQWLTYINNPGWYDELPVAWWTGLLD